MAAYGEIPMAAVTARRMGPTRNPRTSILPIPRTARPQRLCLYELGRLCFLIRARRDFGGAGTRIGRLRSSVARDQPASGGRRDTTKTRPHCAGDPLGRVRTVSHPPSPLKRQAPQRTENGSLAGLFVCCGLRRDRMRGGRVDHAESRVRHNRDADPCRVRRSPRNACPRRLFVDMWCLERGRVGPSLRCLRL
jgi:hypothetical protein